MAIEFLIVSEFNLYICVEGAMNRFILFWWFYHDVCNKLGSYPEENHSIVVWENVNIL